MKSFKLTNPKCYPLQMANIRKNQNGANVKWYFSLYNIPIFPTSGKLRDSLGQTCATSLCIIVTAPFSSTYQFNCFFFHSAVVKTTDNIHRNSWRNVLQCNYSCLKIYFLLCFFFKLTCDHASNFSLYCKNYNNCYYSLVTFIMSLIYLQCFVIPQSEFISHCSLMHIKGGKKHPKPFHLFTVCFNTNQRYSAKISQTLPLINHFCFELKKYSFDQK